MYRGRFAAAYAALALLLGASAYGALAGAESVSAARHRSAGPSCTAPRVGANPVLTAMTFIHTTVERANPPAGFALATPALRGGTTCTDWARGRVPVAAYRAIDWSRARYRVATRGAGQIVFEVLLVSRSSTRAPGAFVLGLRQLGSVWRVGLWAPAGASA